MTAIFDSHAHYDSRQFDDDRDELLETLHKNGVAGIINCGCTIKSSEFSLKLAHKYDFIYASAGIHPHDAAEVKEKYIDKIEVLCKDEKCVAVGEIGLDYHYDFSPREIQREVFEAQLILASKLDLPVIVHDRESHADVLELLKKHRPKGVLHCFSGSVEMAKEIIDLGMYIGLGGAVTFKNAKKPIEVAEYIPIDRLLSETDAPYMTPIPFRGKRCDSSHIAYTAAKVAEVRGVSADKILMQCMENAKKLFNI